MVPYLQVNLQVNQAGSLHEYRLANHRGNLQVNLLLFLRKFPVASQVVHRQTNPLANQRTNRLDNPVLTHHHSQAISRRLYQAANHPFNPLLNLVQFLRVHPLLYHLWFHLDIRLLFLVGSRRAHPLYIPVVSHRLCLHVTRHLGQRHFLVGSRRVNPVINLHLHLRLTPHTYTH